MTPKLPMTKEQAVAFAEAFASLYGGGKAEQDAMVEALLKESAKMNEPKTKGCTHEGRVSHKALWHLHAKADTGPMVDDKVLAGLSTKVSAVLAQQVAEVVAAIKRDGVPTASTLERVVRLIKQSKWNTELVNALEPYIRQSLQSGLAAGLGGLSQAVNAPKLGEIGFASNQLSDYLDKATARLVSSAVDSVNGYTEVRLRDLIAEGLEAGEDIGMLTRRVEDWAAGEDEDESMTRARARMIARSEAARAHGTAEQDAWRATGLVAGKRWLLAPDACEFCSAAADAFGEEGVGINDPFFTVGDVLVVGNKQLVLDYEDIHAPPLHPNCRCATLPVMVDGYQDLLEEAEARIKAGTPMEMP